MVDMHATTPDAAVAAVFDSFPPAPRKRLLAIRTLIHSVAAATDGVGEIDERAGVKGFINRLHIAAAEVGVHPHLVADTPSQQIKDGDSQILAPDVPERLFNGRDGGHADDTEPPEGLTVHFLIEVLDAPRVLTNEHGFEILDGTDQGAGFPFE